MYAGDLAADGWARSAALLDAGQVDALRLAAAAREVAGPVRDAFALSPVMQAAALDERVQGLAAEILQADPIAVRATWFEKAPGANWPVAWHQDRTIAVDQRIDAAGYGPWSVKGGVTHVEPPAEVLHRMIAVRILLDDVTAELGPLRVVPGTHRGKLDHSGIAAAVADGPVVDCCGVAGDAICLRPLLVHGSRRTRAGGRRRVLHLEFAAGPLPPPLRWHTALG